MFYIIDCFSGWLLNIGSFVVRVAYGCSYSHWNTVGVTTRPSQWQNRNLFECARAMHIRCKSVQIHLPPCFFIILLVNVNLSHHCMQMIASLVRSYSISILDEIQLVSGVIAFPFEVFIVSIHLKYSFC